MLSAWTERTLADLLEAHGLGGLAETAFPNDGWSGAALSRIVRRNDGQAFILKRTSWATDWIARSTRDHALREGFIASIPIPLADPLVAPYFGAAADGTSVAVLMPDLSPYLLGWERADEAPPDRGVVDRVLTALARLHAMPWPIADRADAGAVWPTTPLRERLLLLSPRSSARLAGDGIAAGDRFLAGWAAFDRRASPAARALIDRLDRDVAPLLGALDGLPRTGLHGDMKLANVAILDDGRVALIDWQMTALAPVAVELAWLLVSNTGSFPDPPDTILERYRLALETVATSPIGPVAPFDRALQFANGAWQGVIGESDEPRFRTVEGTVGDWATQLDLGWIIGLLLRGWRKGLDAEAGLVLASGVSAADDLGSWCDRAVEAAGRQL